MHDFDFGPYDLSMLCKRKHTSLAEVGRRMRPAVPRSTVAAWANGNRTLTQERAAEMASLLDIDVQTLWRCVEAAKAMRMHDQNLLSHAPPPDSGISRRAAPLPESSAVAY